MTTGATKINLALVSLMFLATSCLPEAAKTRNSKHQATPDLARAPDISLVVDAASDMAPPIKDLSTSSKDMVGTLDVGPEKDMAPAKDMVSTDQGPPKPSPYWWELTQRDWAPTCVEDKLVHEPWKPDETKPEPPSSITLEKSITLPCLERPFSPHQVIAQDKDGAQVLVGFHGETFHNYNGYIRGIFIVPIDKSDQEAECIDLPNTSLASINGKPGFIASRGSRIWFTTRRWSDESPDFHVYAFDIATKKVVFHHALKPFNDAENWKPYNITSRNQLLMHDWSSVVSMSPDSGQVQWGIDVRSAVFDHLQTIGKTPDQKTITGQVHSIHENRETGDVDVYYSSYKVTLDLCGQVKEVRDTHEHKIYSSMRMKDVLLAISAENNRTVCLVGKNSPNMTFKRLVPELGCQKLFTMSESEVGYTGIRRTISFYDLDSNQASGILNVEKWRVRLKEVYGHFDQDIHVNHIISLGKNRVLSVTTSGRPANGGGVFLVVQSKDSDAFSHVRMPIYKVSNLPSVPPLFTKTGKIAWHAEDKIHIWNVNGVAETGPSNRGIEHGGALNMSRIP